MAMGGEGVNVRRAAVALIEREDGRLLCVWNRRYVGWSLPGGMVEEGESIIEGLVRELLEETSLRATSAMLVHERSVETETGIAGQDRASVVSVYRIFGAEGTPREVEPSSPVTWLTREEFLAWSPFAPFYRELLGCLEAAPVTIKVAGCSCATCQGRKCLLR